MNVLKSQLIKRFERSGQTLHKLLDGISERDLSAFPGPQVNNIKWHVGHVTLTRVYFIRRLCPAMPYALPFTPPEEALFVRGGTPSRQAQDYPTCERLLQCFHAVAGDWLACLHKLSAEDMAAPAGSGADSTADLLSFLLVHESYHLGQIGFLRSYYGYSGVFG